MDQVRGSYLSGSISYATDRFNIANSALYLTYSSIINMGTGYINPNTAKSGGYWMLFYATGSCYSLCFNGDNYDVFLYGGGNQLNFYAQSYATAYNFAYSLNVWYHIGFTQTPTGLCNLYVNAALVASAACSVPAYNSGAANGIGHPTIGASSNGYMDDLALFNYYMSDNDMTILMGFHF